MLRHLQVGFGHQSIAVSFPSPFRRKDGLWTKNAHLNSSKIDAKVSDGLQPTQAHYGLVALEKAGYLHHVSTQNYDDLSSRSSFPDAKLSELHGNIFTETCDDCHKTYHRDFEVPKDDSEDHSTGRSSKDCGGILRDSIIHFKEDLPEEDLSLAKNALRNLILPLSWDRLSG